MITSIYPGGTVIAVNVRDGAYSKTHNLVIAKFGNDAKALIALALEELAESVLEDGEESVQIILERIKLNDVVVATNPETGEATAWRHLIPASVTARRADGAERTQRLSSEVMSQPIRDGLITLWLTINAMNDAQLGALQ